MKAICMILVPVVLFLSPPVAYAGAMNDAGEAMKNGDDAVFVDADSLVAGIGRYAGKRIETCGTIVHVCGVDGKKMKLMTAGDARIKVVPGEGMTAFDAGIYNMKKVRVRGLVQETRIDETYIEGIERDRSLLCHIDYTPCLSKGWIEELKAAGTADSISALGTGRLRERVKKTGKGYFSVATIVADSCEVTGDAEE